MFADVEKLDKEIIAIEKLAEKLADGKGLKTSHIKLSVDFEDDGKEKVVNKDSSLVEHQTGVNLYQIMGLYFADPDKSKSDKKPSHVIDQKLSESEIFLILSVLIQHKQQKRKQLLNQIKELGCS